MPLWFRESSSEYQPSSCAALAKPWPRLILDCVLLRKVTRCTTYAQRRST